MPLRTQAARWVTADPTPVMCSTRDTQPSWARSHKERLGKREQGRQKGVRRIQPVLAITNVKFKDDILFLFFFPTELMSTSSRSPLTGSNTVGKDHVTKIGCISEGSGAIDNWFLSLLKQNMLKFKNWARMTICVICQSKATSTKRAGRALTLGERHLSAPLTAFWVSLTL